MTESTVNENEIKTLIDKIKNLTSKEKTHILSILKKHSIEFTKNSNGYFFNLNKISNSVMQQLSKCVELIEKNRNLLVILDKKRSEQLDYYRELIQSKINKTIEIKRVEYIQKFFIEDDHDNDFKPFISKKIKKPKNASDIDIDILIKNHMGLKKYKKDSVYYKILQACTKKTRNISKNDEIESNSSFYDADESQELEGEFEGEYNENDNDNENDNANEYYEENEEEIQGLQDPEDPENFRDETNAEIPEDDLEERDFSEDKFEFFKRLLKNEHGYAFDYDKDVRMECESYIS
jgi:hypothetical protein